MVTHSREVAAGAQRIVRMRDGCVIDDVAGGADGADDSGAERAEPVTAPSGPVWVDALTGRRTRIRRADPGDTAVVRSGP
jgi:hypothetical protein